MSSGPKQHSIKYNFLMDLILKVSTILFPMITFPYVSRVLSPEGLGRVSFATSVISYFQLFAALGIPTYGVRLCTKYRDDRKKLSKAFQELLIINSSTTILSYVVFIVALLSVRKFKDDSLLLIITSANVLLSTLGVSWLYTALEQYKYITVRSLIVKVFSMIALFLLVRNENDYIVYATITVVGTVGSNIYNLIYSRKFVSWNPTGGYDLKCHMKPIFILFAMSLAGSIYTNLDTLMLGFMVNDVEVGYYTAAVKMKGLLVSFTVSLGGVMLPRLAYYLQNNKEDMFNQMSAKAFNIISYIAVPLVVFFMIFAKESVLILSGEGYLNAVWPMIAIMPTVLCISLTNMMGYQILIPSTKEDKVLVSVTAGAIIDAILNFFLIPQLGALGAALGTLAAEIGVLLIQCYYLKSYFAKVRAQITPQYILKPIFGAVLLGIVLKMFWNGNVFIKMMVSSILFFGMYAILFWFEKEPFVTAQVKQVMEIIYKRKKKNNV